MKIRIIYLAAGSNKNISSYLYAIRYGDRLIMLHAGNIILDISGEEKKNLTVTDLLEKFSVSSGSEFSSDRGLLG